jgi:hypothetical protein
MLHTAVLDVLLAVTEGILLEAGCQELLLLEV